MSKNLSLKNKLIIVVLLLVIIVSIIWWGISIYHYFTKPVPNYGGHYIEAYVGQPRYINPLLAHSSSSDKALSRLVFSRLFDYDVHGVLQPDLVEKYEVSDDVMEYTIHLRQDVLWHDGVAFNADDVLYTIGIVQDIAYGAAGVNNDTRLAWQNIVAEKKDDFVIKFTLKEPNSTFAHSLNIGILPKHIWENVGPEQFQLSEFNQKPIGTGAYEFVDLKIDNDAISSYKLRANAQYYEGEPFITNFTVKFYPTRDEAVMAYQDGQVSAVIIDKKEHIDLISGRAKKESIKLPHYFAIFFNQTKSVPLAYDEVREALSRATDRDKIIKEVFGAEADPRYSPFENGMVGYDASKQQAAFDRDSANILLDEKGWKKGDDGVRSKDGKRLVITLHINDNQQQFQKTAELLRDEWKEIGVELIIQTHEKDDLEKNIIKPRDYDAILYAHQMRFEPNLLPLWHSREKSDPGMNYAMLDNDEMDAALEGFMQTNNRDEQNAFYSKQQEILQKEVPAVFLFAPYISFMHSDTIKGMVHVDSENVSDDWNANVSDDRYANVHEWYIKEKRIKK